MNIAAPIRCTNYSLNPGDELNDLRMSKGVGPLYKRMRKFIRETVEPISAELEKHAAEAGNRWSFTRTQLEMIEKAKSRAKAEGLWNFFLPNAHTGEGMKNLDFAYIAAELGKDLLAPETLNCAAPDTGNMEVLERVARRSRRRSG
ncbi:alkylation response protein AidB-like acyl-CoA dehydrogenase [Bradyrhizobium sp. CIR18]|nr:alkylation response protein AidB-like acyl-CoA dehydrogenase [Bradyrhizobium sp. CIR18]